MAVAAKSDVMLVSDVVVNPEEGKVATLLDLELVMTLTEEADLSSSLLRTYWGEAACEADASVELPISSALTDDDELVDVDEDSVATLLDLPSRREEGDLAPTLGPR